MIKGDIKILEIDTGQGFKPVGCLTSNTFSESMTLEPSSNKSSGGWVAYRSNLQGFNITFEGVQVDNDAVMTYNDLKMVKRSRNRFKWRIKNPFGGYDTGEGILSEISESAPTGDLLTFSGSIQGWGAPGNELKEWIAEVEADGGTYEDNGIVPDTDGGPTLVLYPQAYKDGVLYTFIP